MAEDCIELRVDFPGKEYARMGYDPSTGNLRLEEVVYPETCLPADLCSIPNTSIDEITALPALLIRKVSLPPGCRVKARPIGLCHTAGDVSSGHILLCVPASDTAFASVSRFDDLPTEEQYDLKNFLQQSGGTNGKVSINDAAEAFKVISAARKRYRIQQTKRTKKHAGTPTWQPVNPRATFWRNDEAEQHTASEYAYWSLPRRFQKYVEEYLQPNERVLSSIYRPTMRSTISRNLLIGKRLEDSVLILSDRQITLVEEKVPPGQSEVNYGYIARSGVPERLTSVRSVLMNPDVVGLQMCFAASGGLQQLTFEFPSFRSEEVEKTAALLSGWLPHAQEKRLRRATLQNIPEKLPALTDPSCDDPEEMRKTSQRYEEHFSKHLPAEEAVYDWCLLPGWLSGAKETRVLVITPARLMILPESDPTRPDLSIPLHNIASMEFCSTYMDTHLSLFLPEDHHVREESIHFSKTLAAMERCYHSLIQAVAVAPITKGEA